MLGQKCVVFTDNNPLSHLASAKLGATEQHWEARLAAFDFEIKYRSAKSNRNADALLRRHPPDIYIRETGKFSSKGIINDFIGNLIRLTVSQRLTEQAI